MDSLMLLQVLFYYIVSSLTKAHSLSFQFVMEKPIGNNNAAAQLAQCYQQKSLEVDPILCKNNFDIISAKCRF